MTLRCRRHLLRSAVAALRGRKDAARCLVATQTLEHRKHCPAGEDVFAKLEDVFGFLPVVHADAMPAPPGHSKMSSLEAPREGVICLLLLSGLYTPVRKQSMIDEQFLADNHSTCADRHDLSNDLLGVLSVLPTIGILPQELSEIFFREALSVNYLKIIVINLRHGHMRPPRAQFAYSVDVCRCV
jgi:hypothetical protein